MLISSASFGQMLSGDLKDEGRKMIVDSSYVINGNANGYISYELTVDRTGNVTATRLVGEKTNIKSTPARIKVRNYVMGLKFTAGNHYPQYQTVVVKITMVKPL